MKNFLQQENNRDKILMLCLFGYLLFFMVLGFLLGYGLGNEIAYEHYQYQLNLVEFNLNDKLCIVNNETELYGTCINKDCRKSFNITNLNILDYDDSVMKNTDNKPNL